MKHAVFSYVTPCGFCKIYCVFQLLVTAKVPSSPILVTLMMEALSSAETSVLTRATRLNLPKDAILKKICLFAFIGILSEQRGIINSR
jgi:hypothetical protein